MEAVRQIWADGRMDGLNHRVDQGFRDTREVMIAGFAGTIATVLTQV
jgi:hypothetical protein